MAGKSIIELLDQYEPRLRDAFLAAIREITAKAQIGKIAEALGRGDVQAAIDALYIDRAAFDVFERAIAEAYGDGGANTLNGLPGLRSVTGERIVIRFDARNLRAERILREYSSQLVTRIVDEQRQNIRQVLDTGMRQGDNPRTVALDIVGRINRDTGRREGGIVGLSAPQAKYVENARRELSEGNFDAYLQRVRRDKRFDRTIGKAIREGKPLTAEQVNKIVNRYADSLLKLRGDTIGRTEALQSLHMAQHEALKQLVDTGKVTAAQVKRTWDATGDRRTRFDHAVADGKTVGLEERFIVGGRAMLYPSDPAGGAANVINCRCHVRIKIDYFAGLR